DEDRAEPRLLALAELRLRPEEVPRLELEILEVERRLTRFRLRILLGEERQKLLEQSTVTCRSFVERCLLDRGKRLGVGGRAVAPRLEAAEVPQPVGPL